jgi:beta-galactosidase/beta-glucuronidase
MRRNEWLNLNGLWRYAVVSRDSTPQEFPGRILVPFPIESALSGVSDTVGASQRFWYETEFEVPGNWADMRIRLHFEAVDWEAQVWINGAEIGQHRGGYDPFSFDITEALRRDGIQRLTVAVWDPTDGGTQPRGKQVREPGGIFYTSVTGIWGTVWLEPVEQMHVESLKIVPDIDTGEVHVVVSCQDKALGYHVEIAVSGEGSDEIKAKGLVGQKISLALQDPRLWTPDSPFLYDLKVLLKDNKDRQIDQIESYFGIRKISVEKDESGINRLFLNNKVQFMIGPLDQGWWPDGLYAAPTDEALRYDLEVTKQLGMNMLRKHVKIEPRRFYYWCDKLGLLVWQDMPSGDAFIGREGKDIKRSPESAGQFETELNRMINSLYNHPSIVMWVPFNEGWGQYDTERLVDWIKQLDPTRLVNNASGWADRGVGDVHDVHAYPGPTAPANEPDRAAVLGEFGGLGLPIKGHTWQDEKNWGYKSFESAEDLTQAYRELIQKLQALKKAGLSAAIYTQTTDVEIEVNGLMTYDRAIIKMNKEQIAKMNRELHEK